MNNSYSKALFGGFVAVALMASATVASAYEAVDAKGGVTSYPTYGGDFAPEQISAGQVSKGEFGSMTGGGDYAFPGDVTLSDSGSGIVASNGFSSLRFSGAVGHADLTVNSGNFRVITEGNPEALVVSGVSGTVSVGGPLFVQGPLNVGSNGITFADGTRQLTAASGGGNTGGTVNASGVIISNSLGGNLLQASASGANSARASLATGSGISGLQLTSNSNSWYIDNRGSNDVSLPANRLGIFNQSGSEIASFTQGGSMVLGVSGSSAYPNFTSDDRLVINNRPGGTAALTWSYSGVPYTRAFFNPAGSALTFQMENTGGVLVTRTATGAPSNQIAFANNQPTYFNSGANVGIGTSNPQSGLHVAAGKYAQFEHQTFGAPNPADCDSSTEIGRITIDPAARRLYVCMGVKRGWDSAQLSD